MTNITFRYATREDLSAIVTLLADDEKGKTREELRDPLPDVYYAAFDAMQSQSTEALPNKYLLACQGNDIVGCLQLTLIAGLSRKGRLRAQIEGVRVSSKCRGQKVGEKLIIESISISKSLGVSLVQFTTDKTRKDAHRFYERLGFVASHEGMKKDI
ncbi:GNAT family N-acetyltransferase [Thalassospira xiamenensis]|jgi:ribosomal protein S18 acetylase RimI-like enzyme|uniref:GNAT family N-acetyltransferase n=1 Tax=Thalassospira xiamenensis TaxID=220697 RepID=UPI001FFF3D89|nr:GNAT family N-acetyltransferase [Thalassospira xiamenensis]MCK2168473.1 GNAT family N-acetyltransferase [Thalassospira xiamenensis]